MSAHCRIPNSAVLKKTLVCQIFLVLLLACASGPAQSEWRSMTVNATAYTSRKAETQGNPTITAWGHKLTPDSKAVAVSRDLIDLGLTDGTVLRIEGLPGTYRVLDKMHRRWTRKIDIYFGKDVEAARQWGKRKVTITWRPHK